ncbi:MAG: hypothetical protein WAL98_00555 [Desulfatiglandaceae bacterium]|jgi:hypothetical protein
MKKLVILLTTLFLLLPATLMAEDFLGAPVMPGGKILQKTGSRLEISVPKTYDQVLAYYRNALKKFKDIRIRDWSESIHIEDDSNRPWHSITISKQAGNETQITIIKDNWTWIVGTLILRFVGVFVVLMILFVGMKCSGYIISRSVARLEDKKAAVKT